MPTKQSTPKKRRAVAPRTDAPITQEEKDEAQLARLRKRLARRSLPMLEGPTENELKEILAHLSLLTVWQGIRELKKDTKPKFSTQRRPRLAKDQHGTLVWRYKRPLIGVPVEISTSVKASPPTEGQEFESWMKTLRPLQQLLIQEARKAADDELRQAECRDYILWHGIFAALCATSLIRDSEAFAGEGVDRMRNEGDEDSMIKGAHAVLNSLFRSLGIEVTTVMGVAQFADDFFKLWNDEFLETPDHYS